MFRPFDADNHAGLLYSMKPDSSLGLAGPSGVADDELAKYLSKPYKASDAKANKALFEKACQIAANDKGVVAYVEALLGPLDAKRKAIVAEATAKAAQAEYNAKLPGIEAFNVAIGKHEADYKQASDLMGSEFGKFGEWAVKSLLSILMAEDEEGQFREPEGDSLVPWYLLCAVYGSSYQYWGKYAKELANDVAYFVEGSKGFFGKVRVKPLLGGSDGAKFRIYGLKDAFAAKSKMTDSIAAASQKVPTNPIPFKAGADLMWMVKRAREAGGSILSGKNFSDEQMLNLLGFQTFTWRKNSKYFGSDGPALEHLPLVQTAPPPKGVAGWHVQVEDGIAYIVYTPSKDAPSPTGYRFAPLPGVVPTKLKYVGKTANEQPQVKGYFSQRYWNTKVVPAAKNAQASWQKVLETKAKLQQEQISLRFAQTTANGQAKKAAEFYAKTAAGLDEAEAIKSKIPAGFLRGYAEALGKAMEAAADLDAMTESRDLLLKQNADLYAKYKAMADQAAALVAEADATADPLVKQRKWAEGQRRLTRAEEFYKRGNTLRGESGTLGQKRTAAAATASVPPRLPTLSPLAAKVGATTANVAANTSKINELDEKQKQQQAAADATRQQIIETAKKLPEGYKPPNVDTSEKKEEKGGVLGALIAAALTYAALRK